MAIRLIVKALASFVLGVGLTGYVGLSSAQRGQGGTIQMTGRDGSQVIAIQRGANVFDTRGNQIGIVQGNQVAPMNGVNYPNNLSPGTSYIRPLSTDAPPIYSNPDADDNQQQGSNDSRSAQPTRAPVLTSIRIDTEPRNASVFIQGLGPLATARYSETSPARIDGVKPGKYLITITKDHFATAKKEIVAANTPFVGAFRLYEASSHKGSREDLIRQFGALKSKYDIERLRNAPLLREIATLEAMREAELTDIPSSTKREKLDAIPGKPLKSEDQKDYYTECEKVFCDGGVGATAIWLLSAVLSERKKACDRDLSSTSATAHCSAKLGSGSYRWKLDEAAHREALRYNNEVRAELYRFNSEIEEQNRQPLYAANQAIREKNLRIEEKISQLRSRINSAHIDKMNALAERIRSNFAQIDVDLPAFDPGDPSHFAKLIGASGESSKGKLSLTQR